MSVEDSLATNNKRPEMKSAEAWIKLPIQILILTLKWRTYLHLVPSIIEFIWKKYYGFYKTFSSPIKPKNSNRSKSSIWLKIFGYFKTYMIATDEFFQISWNLIGWLIRPAWISGNRRDEATGGNCTWTCDQKFIVLK